MVDLTQLDPDAVLEAAERQMFGDANPGFCLVCGEEQDGCEPVPVRLLRCRRQRIRSSRAGNDGRHGVVAHDAD